MSVWQVSSKQESGAPLKLREFPSRWRAILWTAIKLRECRIVMIVKIDE